MIVLDTHAWIYAVAEPKRLGKAGQRALARADAVGVSAISLWEVAVLVEKERITLDRELLPWTQAALADPRFVLLPLSPAVIATAHGLRGALDGDPGDRLIAATALLEGAPLVTKDARIAASGVVPVVW